MSILFAVNTIPLCCHAAHRSVETIYFEDGSYLVTEMMISNSRASGSVNGSKPSTYYNSSGVAQWKVVLSGSFSFTGSTSSCTSSSMDVIILDSSWYTISKNATRGGNSATGSATIGEKVGGVTVTKIPVNLTLSCDANGNLS